MNIVSILKSRNLKKTAPRIAIINILNDSANPLSENDIKDKMGDMYDRVTFYRSIQTLLEAEIIHRIIVDNVTVRYALNDLTNAAEHSEEHVHFFCKSCNSIICLENTHVQKYDMPKGFVQSECEILIKGICCKCSSTAKKN